MEYATADSDIVIGVGFLHETAIARAANCYPDTSFANIDSEYVDPSSNLVGVAFDDREGGYLAGVIAAGIAASGTYTRVGIISGLPVPAVLMFTTAYTNAVVDFCPACEDSEIINATRR